MDLSKVPQLNKAPVGRPADCLDPTLTDALERFANGGGRYEHLDSLLKDQTAVATLGTWTQLCAQVTVSERVQRVLSIRTAVISAIRTLCTDGDLEASAFAILDLADPPLFKPESVDGRVVVRRVGA